MPSSTPKPLMVPRFVPPLKLSVRELPVLPLNTAPAAGDALRFAPTRARDLTPRLTVPSKICAEPGLSSVALSEMVVVPVKLNPSPVVVDAESSPLIVTAAVLTLVAHDAAVTAPLVGPSTTIGRAKTTLSADVFPANAVRSSVPPLASSETPC